MQGLHLTADLHDCRCDPAWFTDAARLQDWCAAAVQAAGLQAVGQVAHRFPATPLGAGGVTVAVLLAESHLCLHTWPERRAVTADVYVCNFGGDHTGQAQALMDAVVERFGAGSSQLRSVLRGA
jgi:S-adenosylmethionine decarboxylase